MPTKRKAGRLKTTHQHQTQVIKIWGISIIMMSFSAGAQEFMIDSTLKEQYWYVNWEKNRLEFFDESPAFDGFFARLDSAYRGGKHEVNIFHIGGSHIQADLYSHRLRRYFHSLSPSTKGERGFLFPYTLARTNNPWNYLIQHTGEWEGFRSSVLTHESTWGLSGISAITRDSVTEVRISNREHLEYRYAYNQVKIYYNIWDSTHCIEALDKENVVRIDQNVEEQWVMFTMKEPVEEFAYIIWRTVKHEALFLLMGMELKKPGGGVNYHSIGVNGASFETYKRCAHFEHQLKQHKPDLFIISIGTNDTYAPNFDSARYEANYEAMMEMIWRANPQCAILLTVPNDAYYKRRYANPNTAIAARVIYRLARKHQMAVWNFYEIMGGLGSAQKWYKDKLMPFDRIHFTARGYDIKGDLLMTAIMEAWDRSVGRDSTYLFYRHIDPDRKLSFHSEITRQQKNTYQQTAPQQTYQAITSDKGYYYYTIRSGDTLWDIAVAHGISLSYLQQLNPGLNPRNLKIGQRIKTGVKK